MTHEEVRLLERFVDAKVDRFLLASYITNAGEITQDEALKIILPVRIALRSC